MIRGAALVALLLGAAPAEAQQCPVFRVAPCIPIPPVQPQDPSCSGLCEDLSEQMQRGCSAGPDQPYADTVYLRRSGLLVGTEADRRVLALAALAETLDGVAPLTAPLMDSDDPGVRYAAGLQVALTALRAGQIADPRFAEALEIMAAVEDPGVPRSDLLFLQATLAEAEGRDKDALALARAAAVAEPRFFNALALHVRLTLEQGEHLRGSASRFAGAEACSAEFTHLLTALARIADLEPCPRVAAHLELYLSRALRAPDSAPGMQAVQVYLAVLSRRASLAQGALDAFLNPPVPVCAGSVAGELDDLLRLLDEGQP
ncbi:hypothetical protein [Antarctobacter heliothermus]|uniref:Tetratricopeptide repeat protein n=1 Tax=Antarctobacter heliothermus TaxID=74033 RepID=A0A239EC58_9RHOB|nr:hypothetical protein [Antarctobacter heliothermus]SNS42051.1 hypothetical protein SAMN04488078_101454 [Antarctobacter heliothermus]